MSNLNGAYYGPSIPPPARSYRPYGRGGSCCGGCISCCCGCIFNCILGLICKILTFIVVLVVIVALLFWLIVRPNVVKVYVSDATLSQFSYANNNNNNTLLYDLALNVTIRNPNRRVGIYYDEIDALALYQGVRFGFQTLGPFFQHHKNTTVLSPVFKGHQVVPLGSDQLSELETEKNSGVFSIDVRLYMRVRFKLGLFKTGTLKPKIHCGLEVPLKSRNGTSSGGDFQETRCDWDIKRMLFH